MVLATISVAPPIADLDGSARPGGSLCALLWLGFHVAIRQLSNKGENVDEGEMSRGDWRHRSPACDPRLGAAEPRTTQRARAAAAALRCARADRAGAAELFAAAPASAEAAGGRHEAAAAPEPQPGRD